MHTAKNLLAIHESVHHCLKALLDHCGQFSAEEFRHELPGFGYPTMQLQFHHLIGGEQYWIAVLQGRIEVDEDITTYPTIGSLELYREQVFSATEQYLRNTSTEELNQSRTMMTWGNKERRMIPAQVFMRTQTHIFHHQGQITAMCRLLGKPINGLDYPIT